jgi:hypothetical protein
VRVAQRHPDLDAAVLERHHVLDLRQRADFTGAVRPDLQQQLDLIERQGAERGVRVLGEDDHLADPAGRRRVDDGRRRVVRDWHHRREAVVEHRHLVLSHGQLGRKARIARRPERVVLGRRQERPVLAVARIRDPLPAQRVPAEMGICMDRLSARARRDELSIDRPPAVNGQFAPIGLL